MLFTGATPTSISWIFLSQNAEPTPCETDLISPPVFLPGLERELPDAFSIQDSTRVDQVSLWCLHVNIGASVRFNPFSLRAVRFSSRVINRPCGVPDVY